MSKTEFRLDKALIEKKTTLFTNLQMGFVGAALMLMMMDLSKIYLLAPLGAGLILVSWYKSHLSKVYEENKHLSVTMSPKSLLVKIPQKELEQRITFRQIKEINQHQENFMPVVTIYLQHDSEKLELYAVENAADFAELLTEHSQEVS
ncbi:MAG: hypothetical protein ACRBB4_07750 [Neptuniibacter sp.]